MRKAVAPVVFLTALTLAPAAHAAIARVNFGNDFVDYRAAPGEANRVTAQLEADGGYRILDDGATIEPKTGCTAVSPHEVLCSSAHLEASLGDRADTISATVGTIRGDAGNDEISAGGILYGGPGNDSLTGAGSNDELDGGGGSDRLAGGGGDDLLSDGDSAATGINSDTIDGGPGFDRVDYSARHSPIAVDLNRRRGQGKAGEDDRLTSTEGADGGFARSVLTGDGGNNRISAFGPHSVVSGRGGDDLLQVDSPAPDRVSGGRGDDLILLDGDARHAPDDLSCGFGLDRVVFPVPAQLVPADCEHVDYNDPHRSSYDLRTPLTGAREPVALVTPPVPCGSRCPSAWAIQESGGDGPLLARSARRVNSGQIAIRLNRAGRRLLAARRSLDVRIGVLRHGRLRSGFEMRVRLLAKP
jgi:Ca2+-binding RTX toxin-like protein